MTTSVTHISSVRIRANAASRQWPVACSRAALCFAACLLLASCSALRPSFRSPVAPFTYEPSTPASLAKRIAIYQPPVKSLNNSSMRVMARGGDAKGKERFGLKMRYRAPSDILVGVNAGGMIGYVLYLTQKENAVAAYFPKDAQFYLGDLAELDAHPRLLYGIRPDDLVRALLVGQEVTSQLSAMPAGRTLQVTPDHWILGVSSPGRAINYAIRRVDGLVEQAWVYDSHSVLKIRIVYSRYAMFGGVVLPSRFDLFVPSSGLQLTVDVEKATPNVEVPEKVFSLTPPGKLDARPLSEWLERVEMQARIEESHRANRPPSKNQ